MNQRGISLLELLVAFAAGSIVLLAVGAIYGTITWSSKASDAQAYLQSQASIVVDEVTRQVEAAGFIALTNGGDSIPLTCPNGQATTLYVSQPDGSIYCFYTANGQLMEYRAPASGGSGDWNMLSGSPTPLTVTGFDLCGTPPYATCQTTGDIAYMRFQLQAAEGTRGGSAAAPTMTFAVAVAKRE